VVPEDSTSDPQTWDYGTDTAQKDFADVIKLGLLSETILHYLGRVLLYKRVAGGWGPETISGQVL
jgi:hypothetical protein